MSNANSGRIAPNFQATTATRERWLAQILADESLPRNAYRVAGALAQYLNHKTLTCFPAIGTLARLARFVDRTIQRLLGALVRAGYLWIERSAAAFGCNLYRAILPGQIAAGSTLDQGAVDPIDNEQPVAPAAAEPVAPRIPIDIEHGAGREIADAWRTHKGPLPFRDRLGRVLFPAAWLATFEQVRADFAAGGFFP
jgi:hypothetical protein